MKRGEKIETALPKTIFPIEVQYLEGPKKGETVLCRNWEEVPRGQMIIILNTKVRIQ